VTPDARTLRDEILGLEAQLDAACEEAVDIVQVRERDLDAAALLGLVRRVVGRATPATRVVVNDRADVALAAGAAGVHLRSDGPPAARVRALQPGPWIVGRSVHMPGEAARAGDLDYLLCGTVFPSGSKPAGAPVGGLDTLRETCAVARPPVLAIGGITPARVAACREAGAAGVAAIGVFLPAGRTADALGPVAAAAALRKAWFEMLQLPRRA
jgi:thiazole tautomerase (transcriptional regulator TenI)